MVTPLSQNVPKLRTGLNRCMNFEGHKLDLRFQQVILACGLMVVLCGCGSKPSRGDLLKAIGQGDAITVENLLRSYPEMINYRTPTEGVTLLHVAALSGHKNVAEILLAKGIDINSKTESGETPLHTAAWRGKKDVVKLLLEKGADTSVRDHNGHTALWDARQWNGPDKEEIILMLQRSGAAE